MCGCAEPPGPVRRCITKQRLIKRLLCAKNKRPWLAADRLAGWLSIVGEEAARHVEGDTQEVGARDNGTPTFWTVWNACLWGGFASRGCARLDIQTMCTRTLRVYACYEA